MTVTAKITSKGQITLPKEVRKLLDVHEGSVVVFEKENDRVVIKSAKTIREFKGVLKGRAEGIDFDEMRKKTKEYIGRKAAQSGKH
ncbi:MAG: AbrB/MazE/SpoVT family DNA-binding domain-containing protein [Nitrospinae bacterium]|nr:AbrB/MazE/SpoVT family DNA-binding domain-containing protein [Nitrospinota bacterium]